MGYWTFSRSPSRCITNVDHVLQAAESWPYRRPTMCVEEMVALSGELADEIVPLREDPAREIDD